MVAPDPSHLPAGDSGTAATETLACTALKVRRLARRITQIYDEALAPYGLTVGQVGLLASLRRRQGVGVGELAERLSADASTVSRLLKPLEAAGYLALEPDPRDGRAKLVVISDAGAAKRREAIAGWEAAQARVQHLLGEGRLAALRFILDDAYTHL
ncbi:MarR family winged helix-turn-helix transcriptional regulator [Sandarakinorhabdus sp. DWP1-3-1]|uniref:MarR family winged helix-turn-helix transcriptional regulator n=1 Tax=Sandarakinorhabdus sp. DWP1-3-1 TaxID=2804627 RepID=UPI003CE99023